MNVLNGKLAAGPLWQEDEDDFYGAATIAFHFMPGVKYRFLNSPFSPFASLHMGPVYNRQNAEDDYWTMEKGDHSKIGFGMDIRLGLEVVVAKYLALEIHGAYNLATSVPEPSNEAKPTTTHFLTLYGELGVSF